MGCAGEELEKAQGGLPPCKMSLERGPFTAIFSEHNPFRKGVVELIHNTGVQCEV